MRMSHPSIGCIALSAHRELVAMLLVKRRITLLIDGLSSVGCSCDMSAVMSVTQAAPDKDITEQAHHHQDCRANRGTNPRMRPRMISHGRTGLVTTV